MHIKKPDTLVALDDNKFLNSATIISNEAVKPDILIIIPTIIT